MTELPICAAILAIHNSEEMMRQFLNRVCEAVAGHAEEEAV